jgi:hypothetical protein
MTRNDALIEKSVAGSMGKEVIIREIRGKIVVTDKPKFKERILSQKQELVTEFMAFANQLVKVIMSQESLRNAAQIRLNVTRERLYTALVSECWKKYWGKDKEELNKVEKELSKMVEELMNEKNQNNNNILPESQNP